jgi:hypothetical protein
MFEHGPACASIAGRECPATCIRADDREVHFVIVAVAAHRHPSAVSKDVWRPALHSPWQAGSRCASSSRSGASHGSRWFGLRRTYPRGDAGPPHPTSLHAAGCA